MSVISTTSSSKTPTTLPSSNARFASWESPSIRPWGSCCDRTLLVSVSKCSTQASSGGNCGIGRATKTTGGKAPSAKWSHRTVLPQQRRWRERPGMDVQAGQCATGLISFLQTFVVLAVPLQPASQGPRHIAFEVYEHPRGRAAVGWCPEAGRREVRLKGSLLFGAGRIPIAGVGWCGVGWCGFRFVLGGGDVAEFPAAVEVGLKRPVEAEVGEPMPAGDGLDPVRFLALGWGGSEVEVDRAVVVGGEVVVA